MVPVLQRSIGKDNANKREIDWRRKPTAYADAYSIDAPGMYWRNMERIPDYEPIQANNAMEYYTDNGWKFNSLKEIQDMVNATAYDQDYAILLDVLSRLPKGDLGNI